MIRAIAFDFVGVFIKETHFPLDPVEQLLESKFGLLNTDEVFFDWAVGETGLSKGGIESKVKHIIDNIYQVREPDIFDKLPKLKFATATNHLSYIDGWFKKLPISKNFGYFVNSATIGCQKPESEFYKALVDIVQEKPEDILFIDDKAENCVSAEKCGLKTLIYDRSIPLREAILNSLNKDYIFFDPPSVQKTA